MLAHCCLVNSHDLCYITGLELIIMQCEHCSLRGGKQVQYFEDELFSLAELKRGRCAQRAGDVLNRAEGHRVSCWLTQEDAECYRSKPLSRLTHSRPLLK